MTFLNKIDFNDCELVKETSHNLFLYKLKQLQEHPKLNWLNDIDLNKVNFFWCDDMTDENGVMGAFSIWRPYNVYLRKFNLNNKEEVILPTLVHELQHMWQLHKLSIFYFIFLIPIIRDLSIEMVANYYESIVDDILINKNL